MTKSIPVITTSQIFGVLERNAETGDNTFIEGPSGMGKTDIFNQFAEAQAAKRGLEFYKMSHDKIKTPWEKTYGLITALPSTWDSLDIKGGPVVDLEMEATRFLINSVLPNEKRHGKFGFCNFDDLAQAPMSVINPLTQVFHGGIIGDSYVWPKGWQIGATANRREDHASTTRIGAHVYNRFRCYEGRPCANAFSQYLLAKGSDGRVGGFIRLREEHLHNYERGDRSFPSPRQWETVDRDLREIDDQAFLELQIGAAVSVPVAAELMGYLAICSQITSFAKIVKDPVKAKVPTPGEASATAATFALIGMCAGKRLNEKNIDAVTTYVKRLPEDFTMVWMLDVIENHPNLQETVAFSKLRADMGKYAV